MDSKDHYIKEWLVSKPLIMGNLTSHSHEKLKNKKNGTKEMEEEELQSGCFSLFRALADQLPPKA